MANMIQYATQTSQFTFESKSLTEVDAAIFAQAAYFDYSYLNRHHFQRFGELTDTNVQSRVTERNWFPPKSHSLVMAMSHAARYRDVAWQRYVQRTRQDTQEQFAAITFALGNQTYVVSFRGTTNSLVGWKEDFNMTFLQTVPAQVSAASYLQEQMTQFPGKYYLVGHSKGGNLAVYALQQLPIALQANVQHVYSFDGPGSLPQQPLLEARITKLVPQTAIIGMLMTTQNNFEVVHSDASMFYQHDLFSWQVVGQAFERLPQTDWLSQYTQRMLTAWLATLQPDVRANILNNFYDILKVGNATTVAEVNKGLPRNLPRYLQKLRSSDPLIRQQTRAATLDMLNALRQSIRAPKEKNNDEKRK
ncbi:Mbeg1-like protein [Lacticaseibacillus saniviri]